MVNWWQDRGGTFTTPVHRRDCKSGATLPDAALFQQPFIAEVNRFADRWYRYELSLRGREMETQSFSMTKRERPQPVGGRGR